MRPDRSSLDEEAPASDATRRDSLLSLALNVLKWTFYGLFFAFVTLEVFLLAVR